MEFVFCALVYLCVFSEFADKLSASCFEKLTTFLRCFQSFAVAIYAFELYSPFDFPFRPPIQIDQLRVPEEENVIALIILKAPRKAKIAAAISSSIRATNLPLYFFFSLYFSLSREKVFDECRKKKISHL